MQKLFCSAIAIILLSFLSTSLFSQTILRGKITNANSNEGLSAVSVTIKGQSAGTYTDENGNFSLSTTQEPPFTIIVSSIGFAEREVEIQNTGQMVNASLSPTFVLGQDIVVAASRTPERILESPVTIDRISAANIRNAPGPNYYDALANLKGVDVISSSYTFKSISTRGFNGSGNLRFNQLVDGMDNAAPALNFSVGSVIGLTDLDVDNMELLSGASSALYGTGGLNGTLLITSKNPFKYQGFSIQIKEGVMHLNDTRHNPSMFHDIAFRWGKKVSEKFAFKIGAEYINADDWQANDLTNLNRNNVISSIKPGNRLSDPGYDGVNVYGDEAIASMQNVALAGVFGPSNTSLPSVIGALGIDPTDGLDNTEQGQILSYYSVQDSAVFGALPVFSKGVLQGSYFDANGQQIQVSRTGYNEVDIVDYNAHNFKISSGIYYNIASNIEASLTANWGEGTTVYTGADRYSLKQFRIGQYKLEFKSPTWMVRAYTTQENSGDSYASTLAALSVNNAWKANETWFGEYTANYGGVVLAGMPTEMAHIAARTAADSGRFVPGSPQFNTALDNAIKTPITGLGGAQFADKSSVYYLEGQLNLSQYTKVVDLIVGANYRLYNLNSNGTIFADTTGSIKINEFGAYVQLQKVLFNDVLKLTASGRFDKNENFEGRFTPRVTALITFVKNNNIRISFQQAYRFPANQDQYINLKTPGSILVGGLPSFGEYFQFDQNPVYTAQSVAEYRATLDPAKLVVAEFTPVKPETMESYEIGYRGVVSKKILIDAYYYFSKYKNFIAREAVARGNTTDPLVSISLLANPFTTVNYSFVENSPTPVNANGWGIGIVYQAGKGYAINGNVYNDELRNVPEELITFFNTPKYRFNIGLSNPDLYKGLGFNIIYKWQDEINWEGTFGSGTIPSFGTLDAQISYKLTKQKVLLKLGGTNITNNYYRNAFGNPYIGGLYYISIGYNVF